MLELYEYFQPPVLFGGTLLTNFQASSSNSGTSQPSKPAFDPATHHFSPEELKPTPIQRKSRKTLVREEDKDEKYWDKVCFQIIELVLHTVGTPNNGTPNKGNVP